MNTIVPYIWIAGGVQLAIAAANFVLPRKLRYEENLTRVDPIIRQIFVVHSVFIVFVLVAFATLCFLFAPEFGASSLGRFLSGWLALFWALRLVVQWVYYDAEVCHQNLLAHWLFSAAIVYLVVVFALPTLGVV